MPNHEPCKCENTFNSLTLKIFNPLQILKKITDTNKLKDARILIENMNGTHDFII